MIRYPAEHGTLLESDAYRRLIWWSAAAHVLLASVFTLAPGPHRSAPALQPIFVDVVTAASRPVRQAVREPVVIPKRAPKLKAEPELRAKDLAAKPAPTPEQILAQLRRKHGPTNQIEQLRAEAAGERSARVDPERAAYRRRLENLIYGNWAGARSFRDQIGVEVTFEVEVDAGGGLRSLRLVRVPSRPLSPPCVCKRSPASIRISTRGLASYASSALIRIGARSTRRLTTSWTSAR